METSLEEKGINILMSTFKKTVIDQEELEELISYIGYNFLPKSVVRGKIEGLSKYHKEFECNGANNGKGCYEMFCEDQECRNAPKEYNSALSDLSKELGL